MSCRLIEDIRHTCEYNGGGITEIYLLDIRDFLACEFRDDALYDSFFIDRILKEDTPYIVLDNVAESAFSETCDNGLYTQQLTTFVRTLDSVKTAGGVLAAMNKYLVVFRNTQGYVYAFGADGGAAFSFAQASGQAGQAAGYNITLSKSSVYPLFQVDETKFNKILVLGDESGRILMTENEEFAILI